MTRNLSMGGLILHDATHTHTHTHIYIHAFKHTHSMSGTVCLVSYRAVHTINNFFPRRSRVFIFACIPIHLVHVSLSLSLWISAQIWAEWSLIGIVRQQRSLYLSLTLSRSRDIEFRLGSEVKWGADETGLSSPCALPLSFSLPHISGRRVLPSLFWGKYHIMKENIAAVSPSPCSADNLFILHIGIGAQTGTDKIRFIKSSCKILKCDNLGCNYFLKCWMIFFLASWILKLNSFWGNIGRWNIYLRQIKEAVRDRLPLL